MNLEGDYFTPEYSSKQFVYSIQVLLQVLIGVRPSTFQKPPDTPPDGFENLGPVTDRLDFRSILEIFLVFKRTRVEFFRVRVVLFAFAYRLVVTPTTLVSHGRFQFLDIRTRSTFALFRRLAFQNYRPSHS